MLNRFGSLAVGFRFRDQLFQELAHRREIITMKPSTMIPSYPVISDLGSVPTLILLRFPLIVEEKIDGSQISFWKNPATGEIELRSKLAGITAPRGGCEKAVEFVKSVENILTPGIIYRGEFLSKPNHNVVCYSRVPRNNIIIFDVSIYGGQFEFEVYLNPEAKATWAAKLGLETVPLFFEGKVESPDQIRAFLEREPVLGGQKMEGVVIKPAQGYNFFGPDKKLLMGKIVNEQFKKAPKTVDEIIEAMIKAIDAPLAK
jgi:hypothetical protein